MAIGNGSGDSGHYPSTTPLKDTKFTMSYDVREDLQYVIGLLDNINSDEEVSEMRMLLEDAETQIGGMGAPVVEDYENLNSDYDTESYNMRISEDAATKIKNIVEEEFRFETGIQKEVSVEQILAPNRAIINIHEQ